MHLSINEIFEIYATNKSDGKKYITTQFIWRSVVLWMDKLN